MDNEPQHESAKAYSNEIRIAKLERHQKWIVEALIGTILITIIILKVLLNLAIGIE